MGIINMLNSIESFWRRVFFDRQRFTKILLRIFKIWKYCFNQKFRSAIFWNICRTIFWLPKVFQIYRKLGLFLHCMENLVFEKFWAVVMCLWIAELWLLECFVLRRVFDLWLPQCCLNCFVFKIEHFRVLVLGDF